MIRRIFKQRKKSLEQKRQELHTTIDDRKNQLKILLTQKIKDLSLAAENETSIHNEDFIREAYDSMQADLCKQIHELEMQLTELEKIYHRGTGCNGQFKKSSGYHGAHNCKRNSGA